MELEAVLNEEEYNLKVEKKDGHYRVSVGDKVYEVDFCEPEDSFYSLIIDGESYEVSVDRKEEEFTVYLYDATYKLSMYDPRERSFDFGDLKGVSDSKSVASPMPGSVLDIFVEEGQKVKKGDSLIVVEAMKMENELTAPANGKIIKINPEVGETVDANSPLIVVK